MGHDKAKEFWSVFESLSTTAQADYLNSQFGEMLYDTTRNWEDEIVEDGIKELEALKVKELNENGVIAKDGRAILNTTHFCVEVKEDEDKDVGIIIDVFHRHGDLIDTYTYLNDDVIDKNSIGEVEKND